jgi:hypothetical protein
MAKPYMEKNLSSLAGEFAVASQLCLRGYVASLTLKNYPGVDVFAFNPKNGKQVTIQVKASTDGAFNSPKTLSKNGSLIYVSIKKDKTLEFYIIPADIVIKTRETKMKEYLDKHPTTSKDQPMWLGGEEHFSKFKDRWDLLGLD